MGTCTWNANRIGDVAKLEDAAEEFEASMGKIIHLLQEFSHECDDEQRSGLVATILGRNVFRIMFLLIPT